MPSIQDIIIHQNTFKVIKPHGVFTLVDMQQSIAMFLEKKTLAVYILWSCGIHVFLSHAFHRGPILLVCL